MTSASVASSLRLVRRNAWVRSNSAAMSSLEVLPAAAGQASADLYPAWLMMAYSRVNDLSQLPDNWDTYGGRGLQETAIEALVNVLHDLHSYIQSPPAISLTDAGGLIAEWASPQARIELQADPDSVTSVYYVDRASNSEYELPLNECESLPKWLWRASSTM